MGKALPAPASLTILETLEWIIEHHRGHGETVRLEGLKLLRDALAADLLRATGEIDTAHRREIDPAEWRDFIIDVASAKLPFYDGSYEDGYLDLPPLREPLVQSTSAYHEHAVLDRSAPTGWTMPGGKAGPVPSYLRVIRNVRLRAVDVERTWPIDSGEGAASTFKSRRMPKKLGAVVRALTELYPHKLPANPNKTLQAKVQEQLRQTGETFSLKETTLRRAIEWYDLMRETRKSV